MSTRVLASCALVLGILSVAACQNPAPAGLSDADRAGIQQNHDAFAKGINTKDFATPASLYTDDGAMLPPNGVAVQGRQAIQKWMSDFPPLSEFKLEVVDLDGHGDLAYARGNYSMMISAPGAAPVRDHGKWVEVWRKQSDGTWKMRWDIFNSDVASGAGQ
jgi:uncharacterized protein (TIGR02246 family)